VYSYDGIYKGVYSYDGIYIFMESTNELLWRESLSRNVQQFHRYQLFEQLFLCSTHWKFKKNSRHMTLEIQLVGCENNGTW
jgi:hypothetical protein